jgi:hypothetical protein
MTNRPFAFLFYGPGSGLNTGLCPRPTPDFAREAIVCVDDSVGLTVEQPGLYTGLRRSAI